MTKKRWSIFLLCLVFAVSLMGCSSSTKTTDETTAAADETAAETEEAGSEAADETDTEEETEDTTEELSMPEYDALEYVTLGDYKGLTVDECVETIDDDTLEEQIENDMYDYAEETEITDGAADEDYIDVTLELTVDGEVIYEEDEDYSVILGYNEFGSDVDEALVGAKAGDEITVDTTLDDTYGDDYDGKTGTYTIKVDKVYTYTNPELTDDFVKENTDYQTVDEYREAERQSLQESTDNGNKYDAEQLAVNQVIANSQIDGYPQELYDYCYSTVESAYEYYAEMFGMELSDMISDEELAAAAEEQVYYDMVIQAIATTENIEVTDDILNSYLEANYSDYGFESADELKEYYSEEELKIEALDDAVGQFLLDNATINELSREEYDAIYNMDDTEDTEDSDEEAEVEVEETEAE